MSRPASSLALALLLCGAVHAQPRLVLAPEGAWVAVFNARVVPWVAQPFTAARVREIRRVLAPHLHIDLNANGLVQAAVRGTGEDATHYDAVWLRDAVWAYYALRDKRLLFALWDYMASPAQLARYRAVIADPQRALDPMQMPRIRFDGKTMGEVMVGGKPEVWNHRQIDAHGLFFTALGELHPSREDFTPARAELVALWPRFLEAIDFSKYEDAGAWEELPRRNTSSIALATRSLQVWGGHEARLISDGLARVRRQLALGGESPDYAPTDPHFRRADAALLALIVPSRLEGLSEAELRHALAIVKGLERPYGVLRYENDSYQAGDFWLKPPATDNGPTGDTSSLAAFLARLKSLEPHTEAQWFFDSWIALAHLELARITRDPRLREQDVNDAIVHVKRALGQLTADGAIAGDGKPVRALEPPESINTVTEDGTQRVRPSPITPLNWARATLSMALAQIEQHVTR